MTDLLAVTGYFYQIKLKSYGITLSAKNGIEIDFRSIVGLKTIISRFGILLVRMIDHSSHPDEKRIVKFKHGLFTKNNSYRSCANPGYAFCMHSDSSLPQIWPRKRNSKPITIAIFLVSKVTVTSSTEWTKTTSTIFSKHFHIYG